MKGWAVQLGRAPFVASVVVGERTEEIEVEVRGDRLPEPDEMFSVLLSDPGNATVERGTAVGTIEDDD